MYCVSEVTAISYTKQLQIFPECEHVLLLNCLQQCDKHPVYMLFNLNCTPFFLL